MSNLTVKRVQQTLTAKRGVPTVVRVSTKQNSTVTVKATGIRGPQGERGEQGPTGAVGPAGDPNKIDAPDFTLIFDNQLV